MGSKIENNIKVNPEKVRLETDQGISESEERKWGLPLKEVYKHGYAFYRGTLHRVLQYEQHTDLTISLDYLTRMHCLV